MFASTPLSQILEAHFGMTILRLSTLDAGAMRRTRTNFGAGRNLAQERDTIDSHLPTSLPDPPERIVLAVRRSNTGSRRTHHFTVAVSPVGGEGRAPGLTNKTGATPMVTAPLTAWVLPDRSLYCVYATGGV